MASFERTREVLVESFDEGVIDEDEFLLLNELHFSKNPEFPYKLAYPCRYSELIHRFGKPTPVMSMIHNEVVDFMYKEHGHLVTRWDHSILSDRNLEVYAKVINGKGGALGNCFGFVD